MGSYKIFLVLFLDSNLAVSCWNLSTLFSPSLKVKSKFFSLSYVYKLLSDSPFFNNFTPLFDSLNALLVFKLYWSYSANNFFSFNNFWISSKIFKLFYSCYSSSSVLIVYDNFIFVVIFIYRPFLGASSISLISLSIVSETFEFGYSSTSFISLSLYLISRDLAFAYSKPKRGRDAVNLTKSSGV